MNKILNLAFLWHMHQPYYRDDKSGITFMPWVFLHAIKDYYDMPWYQESFPAVKSTFNLVPSLIEQLYLYINKEANDILLETLKKDIYELNGYDMDILNDYLFLSNETNMIKPFARYYELYLKYKSNDTLKHFSYNELLDCEVLFLLSWCGNYLRQTNPTVKILIQKQKDFTQNEKINLINELINFLPSIIRYYKDLEKKGKITVSTTPYFHPITPLLIDLNSAKEAKENANIPLVESSFEYFARKNIIDAVDYFEKIFDKKPTGFWPSEGSVDFKSSKLYMQNDLKWFCSDEEILFKTLKNKEKKNIYKNYRLNIENKTIDIRFRDHFLSDKIGFQYSQKNPKDAASDFIKSLKDIYDSCDFNPLVNIILDGENAWEFFQNNAEEFFYELYALIENTPWIKTLTMDEISSDPDIKTENLNTLATGSWINGNFDIWIGSEEKNKAWKLLDITKKEFENHKQDLSKEILEKVENEFAAALGSDWFWWYGDDHFTVQAKDFDNLFRKHLINIYEYLKQNPPVEILTPVLKTKEENIFHKKPLCFISSDILKDHFIDWLNCGKIDLAKEFTVMDSNNLKIKKIYYGYDKNAILFYLKGDFSQNCEVKIFLNDKEIKIDQIKILDESIKIKLLRDNIFEEKIKFNLLLNQDGKTVQSFPLYSDFYIDIEDLDLTKWYI